MAIPATTPPLSPPLCPPTAAAEASEGFAPAEATPLHRSPVALRVDAAGAGLAAVARLGACAELLPADGVVADWLARGAVELRNTAVLPARVTPAVAPLARAVTELRLAAVDGVRAVAGVRGA